MDGQLLDKLTLLPTNKALRDSFLTHSKSKLHVIANTYLLFALPSLVFSFALLIVDIVTGGKTQASTIRVCADVFRVLYYTLVRILGPSRPTAQHLATYIFPAFFSLIITEVYVFNGAASGIVPRYRLARPS